MHKILLLITLSTILFAKIDFPNSYEEYLKESGQNIRVKKEIVQRNYSDYDYKHSIPKDVFTKKNISSIYNGISMNLTGKFFVNGSVRIFKTNKYFEFNEPTYIRLYDENNPQNFTDVDAILSLDSQDRLSLFLQSSEYDRTIFKGTVNSVTSEIVFNKDSKIYGDLKDVNGDSLSFFSKNQIR